jgi:cytochrome c
MVAGLMVMGMGVREGAAAIEFHMAPGSLKYNNCSDVKESDFSSTVLVNKAKVADLFEPVRFAVSKTGRIFFAERNGGVRVVEKDGTIKKLGEVSIFLTTNRLPSSENNELGLEGIELDPNFETNGFIYLMYQPPTPAETRVSRFKVTGQTMDVGSEQILLKAPNQRQYCCHTGGGLQFDNKGDLWISMGNNTRNSSAANGYVDESSPDKDDQAHAANTNDMRGKTLRIHPLASAGSDGKFYTIPAGNMKEYFASVWGADAGKVLPEIYTMGHRSNWSLNVDTLTGWLMWGDVGPDEGKETEEFNLTAKPGFFGWPYFSGAKGGDAYNYKPALGKSEEAPTNTSKNNTGATKLPPAIPATFGYRQAAAISGPIYHYNASLPNAKRLPPHFDSKWLITDFNVGEVQVATLDKTGKITERVNILDGLVRPIHMTIGHDGILYTLEYANTFFATDDATALKKWEYNGAACVGVGIADRAPKARPALLMDLGVGAHRFVNVPAGSRGFAMYDVQGKVAWSWNGSGAAQTVAVPGSVANGLYRVVMQ